MYFFFFHMRHFLTCGTVFTCGTFFTCHLRRRQVSADSAGRPHAAVACGCQ